MRMVARPDVAGLPSREVRTTLPAIDPAVPTYRMSSMADYLERV